VDYAFAAGGFFLLEGTLIQPQKRVFLELLAFRAQFSAGFMVVSAVNVHHARYGFFLAFHSFVLWVGGLRFHVYLP
jgi:hypothetical protein